MLRVAVPPLLAMFLPLRPSTYISTAVLHKVVLAVESESIRGIILLIIPERVATLA